LKERAARGAAPAPRPLRSIVRLLLSPSLILAGLIGGTIYSAGLSFAMLWGVPFFESQLGIGLATASFCASFYSWGIIVGLPAFGWACGRLLPYDLLGGHRDRRHCRRRDLMSRRPPPCLALLCGFAGGSNLAFVV
jgi:hypothetical protein